MATSLGARANDHCLTEMTDEPHYSDWFEVSQSQIDAFAAATGDRQWIHSGAAKSAGSPFSGSIAHGLLLVSLSVSLARKCGALADATWVLYGFDKLRFRAPVESGARVRCRTTIQRVRVLSGRVLTDVQFEMEIEGHKIPALVTACSLLRLDAVPDSQERVSG